jgi:hypothetical protein
MHSAPSSPDASARLQAHVTKAIDDIFLCYALAAQPDIPAPFATSQLDRLFRALNEPSLPEISALLKSKTRVSQP